MTEGCTKVEPVLEYLISYPHCSHVRWVSRVVYGRIKINSFHQHGRTCIHTHACALVVCTYTYTQHTVFSSGPLYYFHIHLHVCTCSHIIIFTHISLLLPSLSDWVTQHLILAVSWRQTHYIRGAAVDF